MPAASDQLESLIANCLTRDQARLAGRLRRAGTDAERAAVRNDIERSLGRVAERRARLPRPEFQAALPVNERRDEIAAAIDRHQVVVLCGETGSGKTTQLPKICLSLGRGAAGLIGHTQPRRIAARAVASRLADELSDVSAVGCKVRFNDETRPDNFIKVMTDGILLAETRADPTLSAYDTLIIDEAHERSLNIDFLLGYVRRLLPRRPGFRLIITSATIDPQRFADHFRSASGEPAPIIEVSGRTYPVEVRYRPLEVESEEIDEDEPDEQEAILRAVDELMSRPDAGPSDLLVFLSGEREIRETAENLAKHHAPGAARGAVQILPLYARLSADEQQRVFRASPGVRRIVLATNVAETSLTVPGIRYVIDPGFARISRYSPRTKVQRLPIEKISQASANQRKGRCGRVADGVCIRLYSEADFGERAPFTDPEILRTNLAAVILQMASLRLGRVDEFPFIEPPDPRAVRDGYDTLIELGAITPLTGEHDGAQRLTELGSALARFPVDPRIARIILAGDAEHCLRDMLVIASALSIQDPRERPIELAEKADQAHALFADPESDFIGLLKLWEAYQSQKKHLSSSKLRRWCKDHFISFIRMREWQDVHSQLKELAGELGLRDVAPIERSSSRAPDPKASSFPRDALHRALLTGFLSSVGTLPEPSKQSVNRFEYHGPRGLRFNIFPGSGVFKKNPKWLVAAEVVKTSRSYARTVAAVKPEWIEHAGAHLLKRSHFEEHWDARRGQVRAKERVTLFGLELVAARGVHFGPINPPVAREIFIHGALVEGDYLSQQPFARHNREMLELVEQLQHKLRSRDLVVDEQARFAFFDKRIPANVFSRDTFEAWLRGAQRVNPRLLFMSLGDLLQQGWSGELESIACNFPDTLALGNGVDESTHYPLSYLYRPGDPSDGVTLTIPLPALALLTPARVEWLVPGYLKTKVIELIRTLPKELRRALGPAPDAAEAVWPRLQHGSGDLLESLARGLGSIAGVNISAGDFDIGSLPPELRLNIRVLDSSDADRLLAESRDAAALRDQLRSEIQHALASTEASPWNRDGLTDWDFDELPREVPVERAGARFPAYPAIVDPHEVPGRTGAVRPRTSASLRLVDSSSRAEALGRHGLRRLLAIRARDEIRWQLDHAPEIQPMLLSYGSIGQPKHLKDDLVDLVAGVAFLEGRSGDIRTRAQFDARVEEGWESICSASMEAIKVIRACLSMRQSLALRYPEFLAAPSAPNALIAALHPSASDIRLQLSMLLYPGFVSATPWDWLRHVPRYLQGVERRIQRLLTGGAAGVDRDRPLMDQVRPYWVAYLDRARKNQQEAREDPALDEFRWLIEEFRVSLFAQDLGTVVPISAKRLERKWTEVSG